VSHRTKALEVPLRQRFGTGPLHLLVDSTGARLGGAEEGLIESTFRNAYSNGFSFGNEQ
jgi:hypothetical protein